MMARWAVGGPLEGGPLPVTVVIPAFNSAAFLGAALESVHAQTRRPAEVIVVDNGSSDASAWIAQEAGARVLRLERPAVSAARNAGIRATSQPWIAFLDADDLWDPAKLASQWQAVEACPQVSIVITDFTEFDSTGTLCQTLLQRRANYRAIIRREVAPAVMYCDPDSFRAHFLRGNFFAPSAVLARRDLLLDVGLFDEAFTHMEDRELWLRMLPKTAVAVVERPLVHTRLHASNWSSDSVKMALAGAMVAERVLANPGNYPAGALDYYRAELPKFNLNAGRFAEAAGDTRAACRYYLRAWRAGGGLRPLALAILSRLPRPVRQFVRTAHHPYATAVKDPMKPVSVLFIENSVGLSGSTVSLCSLLNYLDSAMFQAHIVLSRPEQERYLRGHLRRPGDLTVIAPRRSLKESFAVQWIVDALERRAPWLRRHILRVVGILDLLVVTLPYASHLRRWAKNRGIELIHQNNGVDLGALLLSRILRAPLVAYQRGGEWHSPFVTLMAAHVTRYIANSKATKGSLVSLGVPAERITVIYPPLDLSTFHLPRQTSVGRHTFGVEPSAPCFGIVGMLLPWKGHEVFLKAAQRVAERVPKVHAFIVGAAPNGDSAYERRLRALAHDLGIGDRVTFTGYRADIPDILSLLDVVVHASVQPEPFGRVIVEAMAMKRPVIATKAGGPLEIIEHGRTGFLVPPGDHEALADRLISLLEDRPLAEHVADAGSREVARRFSADAHAPLVQRVYEQVLEPRRVGALRHHDPAGGSRHARTEG